MGISIDLMEKIGNATGETLIMTTVSSFIAIFFGLPTGITLAVTGNRGLLKNPCIYHFLESIVNITRSVPFIILLVAVIPFTRLFVGTAIGTTAAIVPLSIAAIPFCSRIVESALLEVDTGLVDAVLSMGATPLQVIRNVLIPESIGSIISGLTLMIISLLGYSAMAGAIGGGGLGDLAIRYGYQRFDTRVMIITVAILIVLVQGVQAFGYWLAQSVSHR